MDNIKFVNLNSHAITFTSGLVVPPSGTLARVGSVSIATGEMNGIPLSRVTFGAVEGLPEPEAGVLYIVSALVRQAVPTRLDVASPGDQVRDDKGNVIGCRGLVVNLALAPLPRRQAMEIKQIEIETTEGKRFPRAAVVGKAWALLYPEAFHPDDPLEGGEGQDLQAARQAATDWRWENDRPQLARQGSRRTVYRGA